MQTPMSICRHSGDMEAVDALAQVETNQGYRSDLVGNTNEVEKNDAAYAMRHLAKDAPALHAQVLAGELSPHARTRGEAGSGNISRTWSAALRAHA